MEMNCCMRCGARLVWKEHPTDGLIPYCEACGDYCFPVFSTAVSMVVFDPGRTKILLIRQYGEPDWILPAGYVDKGETAEDAVRRELTEELSLKGQELRFLGSHYYAPSETLMLNFAVGVSETEAHPNEEIDDWAWFPLEKARESVKPGGLAEILLRDLTQRNKQI